MSHVIAQNGKTVLAKRINHQPDLLVRRSLMCGWVSCRFLAPRKWRLCSYYEAWREDVVVL
jgi:hypothetical protein